MKHHTSGLDNYLNTQKLPGLGAFAYSKKGRIHSLEVSHSLASILIEKVEKESLLLSGLELEKWGWWRDGLGQLSQEFRSMSSQF